MSRLAPLGSQLVSLFFWQRRISELGCYCRLSLDGGSCVLARCTASHTESKSPATQRRLMERPAMKLTAFLGGRAEV